MNTNIDSNQVEYAKICDRNKKFPSPGAATNSRISQGESLKILGTIVRIVASQDNPARYGCTTVSFILRGVA